MELSAPTTTRSGAVRGPRSRDTGHRQQALRRAALVNALSPHPWLFWASVGAPLLVRAWREAPAHGVGFVGAFYALLIGSKVAVAALAALGHRVLRGGGLRVVHGVAGVLLVGAGATTLLAIGLRPLLT